MKTDKTERRVVNIAKPVHDDFKKYCDANGLKMPWALETAINQYLARQGVNKAKKFQ